MLTLQRILATGFGLGYAPIASGTFGSMLGVAMYAALLRFTGTPGVAIGLIATTGIGLWVSDAGEKMFATKDPGPVVIDEIAGQLLALLFLPATPRVLLAGFLLFRLFDILKPFPANRAEALPGGLGIMTDDLIAALYANLVLQVAVRWFPRLLGVE